MQVKTPWRDPPRRSRSTGLTPRCAADKGCPIRPEDLGMDGEPNMLCSWDAKTGGYSCENPEPFAHGPRRLRVLSRERTSSATSRIRFFSRASRIFSALPRHTCMS